MKPARRQRIGLLGGTFDPIHVGHLAIARAAVEALSLDRLIIMPTGRSWQKATAGQASAADRLAMVRIAVAADRGPAPDGGGCVWEVDDLEIRRDGPSYTVDTLAQLRQRLGPDAALVLILGSDQLRNLASWHRWEALLSFAHIAATQRERVPLSNLPPAVDALVAAHGAETLPDAPCGAIVLFPMPAVPVSATGLRRSLAAGEQVAALLPPGVEDYIRRHRLFDVPDSPPGNPAGPTR